MLFLDADNGSEDDQDGDEQDENGDTAQEKRSIISCWFFLFLQLMTYLNNSLSYFGVY